MSPLVISYYTSLYEKEALALRASCKKVGVASDIEPLDSFGNWGVNTCYKPQFILKKLLQHQRPVVWVDSDAELLQKPTLFDIIDCDFALRINPDRDDSDPFKMSAGTIYVNFTPHAIELIETWDQVCREAVAACPPNGEVTDQSCLKAVLQHMPLSVRIQSLPPTYCSIFDAQEDQFPLKDLVIRHYQASRLYKKFINQELFPFLGDLSIEELRALRPRINYES